MATNSYFNNYGYTGSQDLMENLLIEVIKIHGIDVIYMPRTTSGVDKIFNEDDSPEFNSYYEIEMFVKNVEGFEGEGDFLSKFGLEVRDSITWTVSIRRFMDEIGNTENLARPNEGDLIYFPLNGKVFEVSHVEHEAIFYQMGKLQSYDLRCELFEYSNETFNTGNPDIDVLFDYAKRGTQENYGREDLYQYPGFDEDEHPPRDDLEGNFDIEDVADDLIDFTVENPFGENEY